MTFTVPASVQVGTFTWKVLTDAATSRNLELAGLAGQCVPSRLEIHLDMRDHHPEQQIRETWFHELLHAAYYSSGLTTLCDEAGNPDEEVIVTMLAATLWPLMADGD